MSHKEVEQKALQNAILIQGLKDQLLTLLKQIFSGSDLNKGSAWHIKSVYDLTQLLRDVATRTVEIEKHPLATQKEIDDAIQLEMTRLYWDLFNEPGIHHNIKQGVILLKTIADLVEEAASVMKSSVDSQTSVLDRTGYAQWGMPFKAVGQLEKDRQEQENQLAALTEAKQVFASALVHTNAFRRKQITIDVPDTKVLAKSLDYWRQVSLLRENMLLLDAEIQKQADHIFPILRSKKPVDLDDFVDEEDTYLYTEEDLDVDEVDAEKQASDQQDKKRFINQSLTQARTIPEKKAFLENAINQVEEILGESLEAMSPIDWDTLNESLYDALNSEHNMMPIAVWLSERYPKLPTDKVVPSSLEAFNRIKHILNISLPTQLKDRAWLTEVFITDHSHLYTTSADTPLKHIGGVLGTELAEVFRSCIERTPDALTKNKAIVTEVVYRFAGYIRVLDLDELQSADERGSVLLSKLEVALTHTLLAIQAGDTFPDAEIAEWIYDRYREKVPSSAGSPRFKEVFKCLYAVPKAQKTWFKMIMANDVQQALNLLIQEGVVTQPMTHLSNITFLKKSPPVVPLEALIQGVSENQLLGFYRTQKPATQYVLWQASSAAFKEKVTCPQQINKDEHIVSNHEILESLLRYFDLTDKESYRSIMQAHARAILNFPYADFQDEAAFIDYDFKNHYALYAKITPDMCYDALQFLNHLEQKHVLTMKRLPLTEAVINEASRRQVYYHAAWVKLAEHEPNRIEKILKNQFLDQTFSTYLESLLAGQTNDMLDIKACDLGSVKFLLSATIQPESSDNWFNQLEDHDQAVIKQFFDEAIDANRIGSVMMTQVAKNDPLAYQSMMVEALFGVNYLPFDLNQLAILQNKVMLLQVVNPSAMLGFIDYMKSFLDKKDPADTAVASSWNVLASSLDKFVIWGTNDIKKITKAGHVDLALYKKFEQLDQGTQGNMLALCETYTTYSRGHRENRALLRMSEACLGESLAAWTQSDIQYFFTFIAGARPDYAAWQTWLTNKRKDHLVTHKASDHIGYFFDMAQSSSTTVDDAIQKTLQLIDNASVSQLSVPLYMKELSGDMDFEQVHQLLPVINLVSRSKPVFRRTLQVDHQVAKKDHLAHLKQLAHRVLEGIGTIGNPRLLQNLSRWLSEGDYYKLIGTHILHHLELVMGKLIDLERNFNLRDGELKEKVKAFYQERGDACLDIAMKEDRYYQDLSEIVERIEPIDVNLSVGKLLADVEEQVEALGYQSDFIKEDELQDYWVFWHAFGPVFNQLTAQGFFPACRDLNKHAYPSVLRRALYDQITVLSKQQKQTQSQATQLLQADQPIMKMVSFVNEIRLMHYAFDKAEAGEAIKTLELPTRPVVSDGLGQFESIMTNLVPLFSVQTALNKHTLSRLLTIFKSIAALHDMGEKDLDVIVGRMSPEQKQAFAVMFNLSDMDKHHDVSVIKAHLAAIMMPPEDHQNRMNDIMWLMKLPAHYRLRAFVESLSTEDINKLLEDKNKDSAWFREYLAMSPQDKISAVVKAPHIANMYFMHLTNFIYDNHIRLKRDMRCGDRAKYVASQILIEHLVEQSVTPEDKCVAKSLLDKKQAGASLTDIEAATLKNVIDKQNGLRIMLYQSIGPSDVLLHTLYNYFDIPKADLELLMAQYVPSLSIAPKQYLGHVWDYDLSALLIWQHGLKNIIENNRSYHLPSIITTCMLLCSLLALVLTLLFCSFMYVQLSMTSVGVSLFMKIFIERQRVRSLLTYASSDKVGLFESLETVKELVAVNQDAFMILVDQMIKDIDLLRNPEDIVHFKVETCDTEILETKLAEYESKMEITVKPNQTHLERVQMIISMLGSDVLEIKWMLHQLDPSNEHFLTTDKIKRLSELTSELKKPYDEGILDLYQTQFPTIKPAEIKKVFDFFDKMSASGETIEIERLLHKLPDDLQHFLYHQMHAIKQVGVQIETFEQSIAFPKGFKFSDVNALSSDDVLRLESANINSIQDLRQLRKADQFDDQSLASIVHNDKITDALVNHFKSKGVSSSVMLRPKEISMFGCIEIDERIEEDQSSLNKAEFVPS